MVSSSPHLDIEALIKHIYDEYIERWKTEGKSYINTSSFEQAYIENTITPIERESTLRAKLPILHRQNQAIPPAIPLLPLHVLRRLAIYLTKALEVQINWDHYDYWAWSAEVFKAFENDSPLLKALREKNAIELLYLLLHLSLSTLGYTPQTQEGVILNRVIDSVVNRHVKHVITYKFVIGIPIATTVFETIIKLIIELYGDDKTKKKVEKLTLGKTLDIFENNIMNRLQQPLQQDIKEINNVIENIWKSYGSNWREILLHWRNKFMHSAETWAPRAFAVYTNYICLLLWHWISDKEYEQKVKEILENIKWRVNTGIEDYWSFYPPPI